MLTTREIVEAAVGDRLAIQGGMTPDLAALYPFFHEGGLTHPETGRKLTGIRRGWSGYERSGGVFDWHPREAYEAGLTSDRNAIITGRVGFGKSTWAKTLIRRGIAKYGERFLVTDVKGEYGPLVESIPGAKELKYGGENSIYLNPLDPVTLGAKGNVGSQLALIASMAVTLMGSEHTTLTTRENSLLRWSIQDCHEHFAAGTYGHSSGVPTMPMLVAKLFNPSDYVLDGMAKPLEEVKEIGYDLALGLQELTEGTLKGMFDKETTPGFYNNTPLLVLNCVDLEEIPQRLLVRTWNYFNSSQYGKMTGADQFDFVILDETWKLISDPEFVKSLVQSMKLGRSKGKTNVLILHRLLSLMAGGQEELANELVNDTSTFISYRQNRNLIEAVADLVGYNSSMVDWVSQSPRYHAMYKVGDQPGIVVEDALWPEERDLVRTDPVSRARDLRDEEEAELEEVAYAQKHIRAAKERD